MSILSREERRKRNRLVSYVKPGTENNKNPTHVVSTKHRYKKAVRDYNKTIKKGKKVKNRRTIRASF